jgi:hypothetical protein
MRPLCRRTAVPVLTVAALIMSGSTGSTGSTGSRGSTGATSAVTATSATSTAGSAVPRASGRSHVTCRTSVEGSRATAFCHNPYPETDRVRLHVECERWWDIDADSAAVQLRAAGYVRLTDRCWKEIRSVWVSHERP